MPGMGSSTQTAPKVPQVRGQPQQWRGAGAGGRNGSKQRGGSAHPRSGQGRVATERRFDLGMTLGKQAVYAEGKGGRASGLETCGRRGRAGTFGSVGHTIPRGLRDPLR
ncbi:unnamed protein product [Coccothraustes coccothraustes]